MTPLEIEIAWRVLPRVGESESGDAVVVRHEGDRRLVALIDALGHGPTAAAVAASAIGCLQAADLAGSAIDLMVALHEALRGSRGAAVTLLCFHGPDVEGCMVGNVDVRTVSGRLPSIGLSGVVGTRLPKLRSFRAELPVGVRIFVHSDGVSRRAPFEDLAKRPADEACQEAIATHRHEHDDSSIIAIYAHAPNDSESLRRP